MIRVGVIGVGNLGQHHARVYTQLPGVELVGIVDSDEARAKEVAKKNKVLAFSRPEQLLGKVDAISVVVPTALHTSVALPFLKAGIHGLIEKPLTTD